MNKKNTSLGMFVRGFVKSFFIITLLFTVGFGSYKLTMLYYSVAEPPENLAVDEIAKDLTGDAKADDVSKNLIYSVDEKTGEIKQILLEIFNTHTYNLDYILIPESTQFTLSNEMYQKMCAVNPDIPQIVKLSEVYQYFDRSNVYKYSSSIAQDLLGENISYYTAMNETLYNTIFEHDGNKIKFKSQYLDEVKGYNETEALKEYIRKFMKEITSNLSTNNKLKYVSSYLKVNSDYIYFHELQGEQNNSGYTVDVDASRQMLLTILSNDITYDSAQIANDNQNMIVSTDSRIQILNGSKISGLGAAYSTKLKEAGYQVGSVGNYNGGTVTDTKIIVKTEGLGLDLTGFFHNPVIVTENLPEDIDIQIILGTSDNLT